MFIIKYSLSSQKDLEIVCLFIFEAAVSLFLLYKRVNDIKSNSFLKIQDYGL